MIKYTTCSITGNDGVYMYTCNVLSNNIYCCICNMILVNYLTYHISAVVDVLDGNKTHSGSDILPIDTSG